MLHLVIREEVQHDLADAFLWYESRQSGLGEMFLASVDSRLREVQRHPEAFVTVDGPIRRALIRRFPFGLFYVLRADEIEVLAVLHSARDDKHWRGRADEAEMDA